jgi:hypothetical protein
MSLLLSVNRNMYLLSYYYTYDYVFPTRTFIACVVMLFQIKNNLIRSMLYFRDVFVCFL